MFLLYQMLLLPVFSYDAILGRSYTKKVLVVYLKFNWTGCPVFYLIVKDYDLGEILSWGKPSMSTPSNFYDRFYLYLSHWLSNEFINGLLLWLVTTGYRSLNTVCPITSTLNYMPTIACMILFSPQNTPTACCYCASVTDEKMEIQRLETFLRTHG